MEKHGKTLTQVLAEARGGLVANELDDALRQAVERSQESGLKSSITVTLTLEPHGKDNKEMHVGVKFAAKLPAKPGLDEKSIFFAVRGGLVRDDPDQESLFRGPRAVEKADGSSPAEQNQPTGTRFG